MTEFVLYPLKVQFILLSLISLLFGKVWSHQEIELNILAMLD